MKKTDEKVYVMLLVSFRKINSVLIIHRDFIPVGALSWREFKFLAVKWKKYYNYRDKINIRL